MISSRALANESLLGGNLREKRKALHFYFPPMIILRISLAILVLFTSYQCPALDSRSATSDRITTLIREDSATVIRELTACSLLKSRNILAALDGKSHRLFLIDVQSGAILTSFNPSYDFADSLAADVAAPLPGYRVVKPSTYRNSDGSAIPITVKEKRLGSQIFDIASDGNVLYFSGVTGAIAEDTTGQKRLNCFFGQYFLAGYNVTNKQIQYRVVRYTADNPAMGFLSSNNTPSLLDGKMSADARRDAVVIPNKKAAGGIESSNTNLIAVKYRMTTREVVDAVLYPQNLNPERVNRNRLRTLLAGTNEGDTYYSIAALPFVYKADGSVCFALQEENSRNEDSGAKHTKARSVSAAQYDSLFSVTRDEIVDLQRLETGNFVVVQRRINPSQPDGGNFDVQMYSSTGVLLREKQIRSSKDSYYSSVNYDKEEKIILVSKLENERWSVEQLAFP